MARDGTSPVSFSTTHSAQSYEFGHKNGKLLRAAVKEAFEVYFIDKGAGRPYYIRLDHSRHTVYISLRGSVGLFEWVRNVICMSTSAPDFISVQDLRYHLGFLKSAKALVKPIASKLRHELAGLSSKIKYNLIFTGHSAGGAVAALLYVHMLDLRITSGLPDLRNKFNRIHCLTFGAPPCTSPSLQKPHSSSYDGFRFVSYITHGDPLARMTGPYLEKLMLKFEEHCQREMGGSTKSAVRRVLMQSLSSRDRPSWYLRRNYITAEICRMQVVMLKSSRNQPAWQNAGDIMLLECSDDATSKVTARLITQTELDTFVFTELNMHHIQMYGNLIERLCKVRKSVRDRKEQLERELRH